MSEAKIDQESLFLAQYGQLWEMKRHHALLCWQVPAVLAAGLGAVVGMESGLSAEPYFGLTIIYLTGLTLLFFRHDGFQQAMSLLIAKMEKDKVPFDTTPIKGADLSGYLKKNKLKIRFPFRLNGKTSMFAWVLIYVSFVSYIFIKTF